MDTRRKVAGVADLPDKLRTGNWIAVVGLFDPLTAPQAERIAAHAKTGRKVLVIVTPGEETLLSQEARTILMAALREVALVVASPEAGWHQFLRDYPNVSVDEDEAAELKRSSDFTEFVLDRARTSRP